MQGALPGIRPCLSLSHIRHFPSTVTVLRTYFEVENYYHLSLLVRSQFLGPRGPLVLPLVNPPALKILTPIYRHICLMNHQETPQTNPLAIWDPLDVSLNPLGPPGTPWPPPSPPWDPKRDLLASLNSKNHLNCLTFHLRTRQIPLLRYGTS